MANYRFSDWKVSEIKADGTELIEAVVWADTVAHIPAYNAVGTGKQLVPPSIAIVPSVGAVKMLDFDNTWKDWGADA